MNVEEIKDFVYEVRTFGITSNDAKFVQITEYLLSELEKEKEKNKEAGVILGKRIKICNEFQLELEKEKERNKELSEHADNLLGEKEYYQDCYDGITFKINNLISQIESAIDFMKTDKLKIKVDLYKQKEEDLRLEIVHLKKLLKEE